MLWHSDGMSTRSSLYRLANEKLDGSLEDVVCSLRAEGLSWERVARRLHADHGIDVASETLRKWHTANGSAEPIPLRRAVGT